MAWMKRNLHQETHTFNNPSYFRDDGYGRGFTSINITCGKCKKSKNLGGLGKRQASDNFVDIGGEKNTELIWSNLGFLLKKIVHWN